MKIEKARVYDLSESVTASGYPMKTETKKEIEWNKDFTRLCKLGNAPIGSGHPVALGGILVSFDLTCTIKMWTQLQRYNFVTFVSSQSTMHKISKFNLNEQYNEYVDQRIIDIMNELKDKYNESGDKEDYLRLLYSNPVGLNLTARITTNYLQLKTIYNQRNNHRLPEWKEFCIWISELPHFKDLCLGGC